MKFAKGVALVAVATLALFSAERVTRNVWNGYFATAAEDKGDLYLVIRHAGKIGGFAGPLPYDEKECQERRDGMRNAKNSTLEIGINDETKLPLTIEDRSRLTAMGFECEWLKAKPVIEVTEDDF